MDSCLDVRMVLDLQRAVRCGISVADVVASLEQASLPGILEYCCLRWANPDAYPGLPEAVTKTLLGIALREVASPLGLREHGSSRIPRRDSKRRDCEFMVIAEPRDVVENRDFDEYLLRFELGAKQIGLPPRTATRLQAAFHEMAANAVTHAKAPVPALVGYETRGHAATFCVVDVGIGVLKSLGTNPLYAYLSVHSEAIKLALREGVSSIGGDFVRGNGFRAVFKSLAEQYGILRFRSGEGCVEMHGMDLDVDKGEERRSLPYLDGFQVAVSCSTRALKR